jgi:hypothetical protein
MRLAARLSAAVLFAGPLAAQPPRDRGPVAACLAGATLPAFHGA